MKKVLFLLIFVIAIFGIIGCAAVEDVMRTTGMGVPPSMSPPSFARDATRTVAGVDFKSGEVLCGTQNAYSPLDNTYYVAKTLTPASVATDNQAEVLFVHSGKKSWTKYVIPSHKAQKEELKLGMIVFKNYSSRNKEVTVDQYRKYNWKLGRITSTDELFKGVVEIEGKNYYTKWLRVPNQPIE